jgi:hypothetical protein
MWPGRGHVDIGKNSAEAPGTRHRIVDTTLEWKIKNNVSFFYFRRHSPHDRNTPPERSIIADVMAITGEESSAVNQPGDSH